MLCILNDARLLSLVCYRRISYIGFAGLGSIYVFVTNAADSSLAWRSGSGLYMSARPDLARNSDQFRPLIGIHYTLVSMNTVRRTQNPDFMLTISRAS